MQLPTAPLGFYHSGGRLPYLLELVPGLNFIRAIEKEFDVKFIWAAFNVIEYDRLATFQLVNFNFCIKYTSFLYNSLKSIVFSRFRMAIVSKVRNNSTD